MTAPCQQLYEAWTKSLSFDQWFGRNGYTTNVFEMDDCVGGLARFTIACTNGTVYTIRITNLKVEPNKRIVLIQGSDTDHDPRSFRVTATFDAQTNGK